MSDHTLTIPSPGLDAAPAPPPLQLVTVDHIMKSFGDKTALFRALDREWGREWGGWRAVLGSAAFFAIYHGPLSWLPVGVLGIANALLSKKTGRLAPAIVLHMVYNAVVLY